MDEDFESQNYQEEEEEVEKSDQKVNDKREYNEHDPEVQNARLLQKYAEMSGDQWSLS